MGRRRASMSQEPKSEDDVVDVLAVKTRMGGFRFNFFVSIPFWLLCVVWASGNEFVMS